MSTCQWDHKGEIFALRSLKKSLLTPGLVGGSTQAIKFFQGGLSSGPQKHQEWRSMMEPCRWKACTENGSTHWALEIYKESGRWDSLPSRRTTTGRVPDHDEVWPVGGWGGTYYRWGNSFRWGQIMEEFGLNPLDPWFQFQPSWEFWEAFQERRCPGLSSVY